MTLNLILWLIVLAAGVVLEAVGLWRSDDPWQPLTYYVRRYIPHVVVAAAIIWLGYHFGVAS
jgi:hypothetical protein